MYILSFLNYNAAEILEFYLFNTMVADNMATQGAREIAAIVLT